MVVADGMFFRWFFERCHPKLGTQIRVNTLFGVVAATFMLAVMQVSGSNGAMFDVVLTISTFLLSYLMAIPALDSLRPHETAGLACCPHGTLNSGSFQMIAIVRFPIFEAFPNEDTPARLDEPSV